MAEGKLTNKQQAFINEYLLCWNATEAARRAGYSNNTAGVTGYENLRKPHIAEEIQRRIDEMAMTSNEALVRLSQHARGDIGKFLLLSLDEIANHPESYLIKKIKVRRDSKTGEEYIELELHDPQSALGTIIKQHQLNNGEATERIEVSLDDKRQNLERRIASLAASRGSEGIHRQSVE